MLADMSQLIFLDLKTQPLLDFMVKEMPGVHLEQNSHKIETAGQVGVLLQMTSIFFWWLLNYVHSHG